MKYPHIRIKLHGLYHSDKSFSCHDTIGVEDDHVAVAFSPSSAKICYIAAFPFHIALAVAVKNRTEGVFFTADLMPCSFLMNPDVRVCSIAKNENAEHVVELCLSQFLKVVRTPAMTGLHLHCKWEQEWR